VTTSAPPIFVVGCHRSGTTLLRLLLDSHPNISCGPETGFLTDFARITRDPMWPHLRQYGFPKEYWHGKVAELFDSFQTDYARARGKLRWAEKTPNYALHLDYVNELFPTCQVIHIIRDGRDVVASHLDRWGYISAVKATRKWPLYIDRTRRAGARLPAHRYREVRYEDLVGDTEAVMRGLLDFLGEPWDEGVLQYDQRPHDVQPRYVAFSSGRRVATKEQQSVYRSRVGAHRQELSPPLRLLTQLVAGRTLRALDYR
jgi:Sulfotransferase family